MLKTLQGFSVLVAIKAVCVGALAVLGKLTRGYCEGDSRTRKMV